MGEGSEGEENFPVGNGGIAYFLLTYGFCVMSQNVTNTYTFMLGFMIEDRLSKYLGKLNFLKDIHFPCCNLRQHFFLSVYYNSCLTLGYFVANTLTILDLA